MILMGSMLARAIIFIMALALYIAAKPRVDFLILANPNEFRILNLYEQPLSEKETLLFAPYCPLQVKKKDGLLGDEITPALHFSFQGKTWYLLKGEKGKFLTKRGAPGSYKVLRNCTVLGDTIQVVKSPGVKMAKGFPGSGRGRTLEKGAFLIRIFKHQNRYYLKAPGQSAPYGWSSLSNRKSWRQARKIITAEQMKLNPILAGQLISSLQSANALYEKYFKAFNRLANKQKTIPQWKHEPADLGLRCWLQGPQAYQPLLEESTRYLVNDLENILIGKPFSVVYLDGEIIIESKFKK